VSDVTARGPTDMPDPNGVRANLSNKRANFAGSPASHKLLHRNNIFSECWNLSNFTIL
jgi:hypothetical protein